MTRFACLDACGRLDNTVPRPCAGCVAGNDKRNPTCVHYVDTWDDDGVTYRRTVRARVNAALVAAAASAPVPAVRRVVREYDERAKPLDMRAKLRRIKFRY